MKRKNRPKIKRGYLTDPICDSIDVVVNDDYRLSRWAALSEAVDLIYEHSLDRNTSFNDVDLKPLAIQKYVESKSDEIMQRLTVEKSKKLKNEYSKE